MHSFGPSTGYRALAVAVVSTVLAIAAGCGSAPPAQERRAELDQASRQVRQRGYLPERRYAVAEGRESWRIGDAVLDVAISVPADTGSYPLVVYLPGLGESADGGAAWRRAWTEAGYAVVSMQPADVGISLWGSPAAKAGDFKGIARQQFSRKALADRLALLREGFRELVRRRESGANALLARVDPTRVALAGFDLGAQSAVAAAGEAVDGGPNEIVPRKLLKAVIALSPYADAARAGFDTEFGGVGTPVLSVTGLNDLDPYGFVTSAAVRRVPYEYMPPGGKVLAVVYAASHTLLSGRPEPTGERRTNLSGRRPDEGAAMPDAKMSSRRLGAMDTTMQQPRDADGLFAADVSPAAWGAQLGTVQTLTGAYLDAKVKGDDLATEWFARDAVRWLADGGELRTK
jgi:hypothetical protein